jgi:hypothetical protein
MRVFLWFPPTSGCNPRGCGSLLDAGDRGREIREPAAKQCIMALRHSGSALCPGRRMAVLRRADRQRRMSAFHGTDRPGRPRCDAGTTIAAAPTWHLLCAGCVSRRRAEFCRGLAPSAGTHTVSAAVTRSAGSNRLDARDDLRR